MTTTEAPRPSFWQRALDFALKIWDVLRRPSSVFSLAFLVLAGFVAGIFFWGAFNTALELTNTETFCTSCHEMRDNVFAELKTTVHYTNRSGVRAHCPDCHGPPAPGVEHGLVDRNCPNPDRADQQPDHYCLDDPMGVPEQREQRKIG